MVNTVCVFVCNTKQVQSVQYRLMSVAGSNILLNNTSYEVQCSGV